MLVALVTRLIAEDDNILGDYYATDLKASRFSLSFYITAS